jgi:hypothetical protein
MSGAEAILAQLRAQRLYWVDMPAQDVPVRLQLDTPSLQQAARLGACSASGDLDQASTILAGLLRGWTGVTEALLLGAGVGSDSTVPADGEVLRIMLASRPEWASALLPAAIGAAVAERERSAVAAKNSGPGSTPSTAPS